MLINCGYKGKIFSHRYTYRIYTAQQFIFKPSSALSVGAMLMTTMDHFLGHLRSTTNTQELELQMVF